MKVNLEVNVVPLPLMTQVGVVSKPRGAQHTFVPIEALSRADVEQLLKDFHDRTLTYWEIRQGDSTNVGNAWLPASVPGVRAA